MILAFCDVVPQLVQPFVNYFGYKLIGLTYEWGMNDWAFYLDLWGAISPFGFIIGLIHAGLATLFNLLGDDWSGPNMYG